MKTQYLLLSCLLVLSLVACGKKTIDYKEKLTGIWQISNVGAILKMADNYPYNADALRTATIAFKSGGKLVTNVGKVKHEGEWSVSEDGTILTLKADSLPFNERLPLVFENEQTIVITNTGKKFVFKKISG